MTAEYAVPRPRPRPRPCPRPRRRPRRRPRPRSRRRPRPRRRRRERLLLSRDEDPTEQSLKCHSGHNLCTNISSYAVRALTDAMDGIVQGKKRVSLSIA